jgi:hypothetical protein
MSLSIFKRSFENSYQDVFLKVLVGMKIANTRLQAGLKFGQSVDRALPSISSVRVRTVTVGSDRTVDSISDTRETLSVDQKKGTTFALSDYEKIQAGPLDPGTWFGAKCAHLVATYVDADILAQTVNAAYDFDNGDLTTTASTGTGITLSSTTVPQLVSRAPAKLKRNNINGNDLVFVIDAYGASDLAQYLLGKNIDLAGSVYANGYTGSVSSAELYVSENLTGEAVLSMATTPTDGDTVVIGGVTFTFKTTLGVTAGNVLIGGSADVARANLTALINDPATTTANGVALSAANQIIISDNLRCAATNDNTANTMTLVCTGSGRLTLSETFTDGTDTWTKNFLHCYFGKKGAIDCVVQDMVDMEMRQEPKQRTTNIFADVMYGIKTFTDGTKQFLDVLINA